MEIERRLSAFPVPESVQAQWVTDTVINTRGVQLDTELIDGALHIADIQTSQLTEKAKEITGLNNPNSNSQLIKWLADEGIKTNDLQKQTVSDMLESDLADNVRGMLEIRQELNKTSNKKYDAMVACKCSDNRARGLLQFYGANRTGRWGGRFIQPQNMPRTYISGGMLELARELVKKRDFRSIEMIFGSVQGTLSQLVRTALVAKEGCTFIDADFSAIEARVVAWLAGEQWVIDVFNTHGKIYEATAAQMFGVPIDKIKKGNPEYALRQKGKVATLALGYGGTTNALINMGALRMGLDESELPEIVSRWRSANRRICDLWQKIETAAMQAFKTGTPAAVNGLIIAREGDSSNGLDFITVTRGEKTLSAISA